MDDTEVDGSTNDDYPEIFQVLVSAISALQFSIPTSQIDKDQGFSANEAI